MYLVAAAGKVWGKYCGSKVFRKRATAVTYVKVTMNTGSSSSFTGFQFEAVAVFEDVKGSDFVLHILVKLIKNFLKSHF